MPQLVGSQCAICHGRIGSELDASFCSQCKFPTHKGCISPAVSPKPGQCSSCGTDLVAETARRDRKEERQRSERPVVLPPQLAFYKIRYLYRALQLLLVGLVAIALGILLVLSPGLRADPKHISAAEIMYGIVVIVAGVVMCGLAVFVARRTLGRRKSPD